MILGEGLNYSYTSKIIGKEETENFVFFFRKYSGIFFFGIFEKFRKYFGISGKIIFPEIPKYFFRK